MRTKQKQRIHFSWYKESLLIIMWFIIKNTTKHKDSNNWVWCGHAEPTSFPCYCFVFFCSNNCFCLISEGLFSLLFFLLCFVLSGLLRFIMAIKGKITHLVQYLPPKLLSLIFSLHNKMPHIHITLVDLKFHTVPHFSQK